MYDLAAEELGYAIEQDTPTNAKYWELAQLYHQAGNYYPLYKLIHNHFSYWIIHGDERLPEMFWKLAYPLGFYDIVQSHAAKYKIDPLLVLSIILAESVFDPNAYAPDGGKRLIKTIYLSLWPAFRIPSLNAMCSACYGIIASTSASTDKEESGITGVSPGM